MLSKKGDALYLLRHQVGERLMCPGGDVRSGGDGVAHDYAPECGSDWTAR
jgi:hypothetical protein